MPTARTPHAPPIPPWPLSALTLSEFSKYASNVLAALRSRSAGEVGEPRGEAAGHGVQVQWDLPAGSLGDLRDGRMHAGVGEGVGDRSNPNVSPSTTVWMQYVSFLP